MACGSLERLRLWTWPHSGPAAQACGRLPEGPSRGEAFVDGLVGLSLPVSGFYSQYIFAKLVSQTKKKKKRREKQQLSLDL